MLNESHLNPKRKLKLSKYYTYRTDRPTMGIWNGCGTAILICRKFTHSHIHIHTTSIENTILHIQISSKELRLGVVNSRVTLKLKIKSGTAERYARLEKLPKTIWNNTVIAPNTPTHFSNIHHQNPDVLDITLVKTSNIKYDIRNLTELSSNHNPILLNIISQSNRNRPPTIERYIKNWKKFALHLHETPISPNPIIYSKSALDIVTENVTTSLWNYNMNLIRRKDYVVSGNGPGNIEKKLYPIRLCYANCDFLRSVGHNIRHKV